MKAFDKLVASDALQVQCENEVYYLILAWLDARKHDPPRSYRPGSGGFMSSSDTLKAPRGKRLMSHLRYQHLTPGYVMTVLCNDHDACGGYGYSYDNDKYLNLPTVLADFSIPKPTPKWLMDDYEELSRLPVDRSQDKRREWKLRIDLPLEKLLELEENDCEYFPVGLTLGYPLYIYIRREQEGTFGVY